MVTFLRAVHSLPWSWAAAHEVATISVMNLVDRIARIRIELNGINPTTWRRVDVPLTTSLKGLHDVIQAVMPFVNYHLFRFDVGDKRYGIANREWDHVHETLDAKNIRLGTLVERGVNAFSYTYDFGDDWQHSVAIENITAADPKLDYPRFIDGSRRAPPEDVGGIPGFEEFLDAMTNPRHPEHRRLTEWYGGSFDPDDLNLPVISDRIGKLARRRALGKAGYAKSHGPTH
jgi:Plasmid pRiA4b ORF-3-like protein